MENSQTRAKHSTQKMILTIVYVMVLIAGNILGVKQISVFGLSMTAAIITFPITYILSDVFSEVYGYKWSRQTALLAFIINFAVVGFFMIAIHLPSSEHWNDQAAYALILGGTLRLTLASLLGFYVGDLANDIVFREMKKKERANELDGFALRSILSSTVGQIVDSIVFIPIAFLGIIPLKPLFIGNVLYVFLKIAYEIVVMPITKAVVVKVKSNEEGA